MVPQDFMQRIEKTEDGCWLWLGPVDLVGYGRFSSDYKNWLAHRYVLHIMGKEVKADL